MYYNDSRDLSFIEDPDEDIDIGTCQGCGRYGKAGDVCNRMIDGQIEECGEFL